ncbi:MAG: ABC transporter permease [Bacteroidia bacterium]
MVKRGLFLLTGLILLLPLVSLLYLTIVHQWTFPEIAGKGFYAGYWRDFFTGENNLYLSAGLSLFLAGSIAATATFLGFFISYYLSRQPGILKLAYFPYLIAPVVFGTMLQYYFVRMNLTGTVRGVMIAQFLFIFPYSVLLFSTFWNDRVRQTAFQATTLGASPDQVFLSVLLPMARPWFFLCFAQCFLISWFEYGITQLIGVGKIETLTIKTMFFVKEANPHLAALSACLMVLPMVFLLVIQRNLFLARTTTS